ncbi:MAG: M90 family metallopeptidase [Polyangiaceae bacterium]
MGLFDYFKNRRRDALRRDPFTDEERRILERDVPYLAKLDAEERKELEELAQIFLHEKSFEGCGGLVVTEEMKLVIAAQACLLILHRDSDVYPGVDSILVYPTAYRAPHASMDGGVLVESEQARLGETSTRGAVVLTWDSVRAGASATNDGHNVVLHEFAHQLDGEDGAMDGAPDLGSRDRYRSWAHVLSAEYADLRGRLDAGRRSDIDAYGATNPAEFFAVLTEMFFERGRALRARHPELYEELVGFYRQDPANRG